jgi:hypothetical protein
MRPDVTRDDATSHTMFTHGFGLDPSVLIFPHTVLYFMIAVCLSTDRSRPIHVDIPSLSP